MAALHVSIQFPDNNNNISAQSTLVECGPLNEADHCTASFEKPQLT